MPNQNDSIQLVEPISTVANVLPIDPIPPPPPIFREEPKLPEMQVPIKKYYGRKRGNESSSNEDSYSECESHEKAR